MRWLAAFGLVCAVLGCSENAVRPGAERDAGEGERDAGDVQRDAGEVERDAGEDAGEDASAIDAGLRDGASVDAGTHEEWVVPTGYWAGIRRRLPQSPSGRWVAVSCHNCYRQDLTSSAENLRGTLERIEAARADGADIIELDVKVEADEWYVQHDDDGSVTGARLSQVLGEAALATSDHLLFVEIKETTADEDSLRDLVALLTEAGLAGPGRYLTIRSFEVLSEQLWMIERMLAAGEFAPQADYLRTQVLYTQAQGESPDGIRALIDVALDAGAEGVEFNHHTDVVYEMLDLAESLELGTNVWTFSVAEGTDKCREFRDLTDALTTDSRLDLCRAAVRDP
jgi:glycerophosphoryl diester phosphodiesterase